MALIDQIIKLMQSHQGESIVLVSNQDIVIYRADGSSVPTKERFSLEQLNEMLNEILSDQDRTLFVAGMPVRLQYQYENAVADIYGRQGNGNSRLNIALEKISPLSTSATTNTTNSQVEASTTISEEPAPEIVPPAAPTVISEKPISLRTNRVFFQVLPWSLRWSAQRHKVLGLIIGLIIGVGTSVVMYMLASKESMLGHMFNLSDPFAAIPVSISCMFFWGVALCLLRWFRLRDLERTSHKTILLDAKLILSSTGLEELSKELESPVIQISPLLRRLYAVVQQWLIKPSLQDADVVLEQHVVNDEEEVRRGYNLIRTFVWALPVLGLIGTVIGISVAVGGFAQFLGGNVEEVAEIKKNLVEVTGGLSFAFLITLQGLFTSLLLMLSSSALQTREEKLYTGVQQDIADIFLPVLQKVAPELKSVSDEGELVVWRETLRRAAETVLGAIRSESTHLIKVMDEKQVNHREQVSEWSRALRQEMNTAATGIGAASAQIGRELVNAGNDFLNRVSLVREALDQQTKKLHELFATHAQTTSQQQGEIIKAISEQSKSVQSTAEIIAGLSEATIEAIKCQATLQTAIRQLNESKLDHTYAGFVEALATQSREMGAMGEALSKLTEATGEVLNSQATLQTATRQLQEADFSKTLTAFRDSLVTLGPILASFREPFVFQAVPVGGNSRGTAVNQHKENYG